MGILRLNTLRLTAILLTSNLQLGCLEQSETVLTQQSAASEFDWGIPDEIPLPIVPDTNPMTEAKFQLGRHLFYDERLSGNGSQACASCHEQERAFAEGRTLSVGSTGEIHPRNSMALVNVAYNPTLTWANPILQSLEQQVMLPLFGEGPIEQGINDGNIAAVYQGLAADPVYQQLLLAAFPNSRATFSTEIVVKAIASFVRGLVSFASPLDLYNQGDTSAISAAALRGRDLFFSEELECFHCHGGYNFTDSLADETTAFLEKPFHNTGLFNLDGDGLFPADNQGVYSITGRAEDMGKFRAVTLRNIEVTGPYMHDGSIDSLSAVIDFYSAGGRLIESGPLAGDGRVSPLKDGFISGFTISAEQKSDLIMFLKSLTDRDFLTKERFQNPWQ